MDSSTTKYCRELEKHIGSAQALARLTGSRAFERFTVNQIAKLKTEQPETFAKTERISLISSFMCSLFLGKYAAIDYADGSGMNLLSLAELKWESNVENFLGKLHSPLSDLLGEPCPAALVLGHISSYFIERYGFGDHCRIVAWSGDNPCSLAGIGLGAAGEIGISLGTSDTLFFLCDAANSKPALEGHVFVSPISTKEHMVMLCYKNGSLARVPVCKNAADGDWKRFDELIRKESKSGNKGNVGFYFP